MKRVVQVRLLPSVDQDRLLEQTLRTCNEAAGHVARVARERGILRGYDLRAVVYGDVRSTGLGAQAAKQTIRKVVDAYATHRANLKAGRYGRPGTPRREKAATTVIAFRPDAAQPYDDRILSWDHDRRTVSIWTLAGRRRMAFTGHRDHLALLAAHRQGESDLVHRDGKWYLHATVDLPDPPVAEPAGFLGVDLGIVTIASVATDHGTPVADWSGGAVTTRRKRNRRLRARLQSTGTRSARRLLKKRSRKERRFAADVNHQISRRIVAEAERTGRGIAVEDLTGISERVRHRKPQRATLHSWAFAQLATFLAYKAQAAGVAFTQVDPAHTSQTCSACGNTDPKARNGRQYTCSNVSCAVSLDADMNAAVNIARLGVDRWAAVNLPHAA